MPNTCFVSAGSVPSTVLSDFKGVFGSEWHDWVSNYGDIHFWSRGTL